MKTILNDLFCAVQAFSPTVALYAAHNPYFDFLKAR